MLPLPLACSLALAGARPEDPALARLDARLRELDLVAEDPAMLERVRLRTRVPLAPDAVSVVLEPAPGVDIDTLLDAATDAGFAVEAVAAHALQVSSPYARLRALGTLPGLRRAREPFVGTPKDVVTEGLGAAFAVDWHAEGLYGRGVTIGVVDVGFAGIDDASPELPSHVVTDYTRGDAARTAHGTAVVEVIHDFAPAARYRLATFTTDVELAEVIEAFVEDGVDVINASVGFDNVWHADGTSALTRAADAAVEAGTLYVAAAGNENERYRVGELSAPDENGVATIAGAAYADVDAPDGYAVVSLRWSEPFGAAAVDLDLVLVNEDGTECARSEDWQDGQGDPYELARGAGCSEQVRAYAVLGQGGGDPSGLTAYLYSPDGLADASLTGTETLTLPADTVLGLSVGAYRLSDDAVTSWSSRGPTNDGRDKPDLVAPTSVHTAVWGEGGFDGTSAAAAHATGVAALWIDATGRRNHPDELKAYLLANARDLDAPGVDPASGAGALRTGDVPGCGCGASAAAPSGRARAMVVGVAALALARRRHRPCPSR